VPSRPRISLRRCVTDHRGQASVELVAAVPLVLLVGLAVWQATLAGHALWMCANAARVAARADVVDRDVRKAALSALPRTLERGATVKRHGTRIRVAVRVPLVLHASRSPLTVAANASLGGPQ
jgi:type IV secretory pathway TrbD component